MTFHNIDDSIFKRPTENIYSDGDYWKPTEGRHTMRILPPYSPEGRVFRPVSNHPGSFSIPGSKLMLNGKQVMPVCLSYLFSEKEYVSKQVLRKFLNEFKISKSDYKNWKNYGCPLCEIASLLKLTSTDDNMKMAFMPKIKYFLNLFDVKNKTVRFSIVGVIIAIMIIALPQDSSLGRLIKRKR